MRIKITYKSLIKKLHKINFIEKRMAGSHLILANIEYDSTLVLPISKQTELVPDYFLRIIRKNIVEKGIMTDEQFYDLMRNGG